MSRDAEPRVPRYVLRNQWRIPAPEADDPSFYDLQFYPFDGPTSDASVFALAGDEYVIVASIDQDARLEALRVIKEVPLHASQKSRAIDCLAWTQEEATLKPLLAVSGEFRQIRLIDPFQGVVRRTLEGHGALVDCILTSPRDPHLLASASGDHTITVWDLREEFEKQPRSVIIHGSGPNAGFKTLAWHRSGRYLLSGGYDTRIDLWVIPLLPDHSSGTDHPHTIRRPHFSSSEIHTDYIDQVMWHGDLILSKASAHEEKRILLWRIIGFDPDHHPVPFPSDAPTDSGHETRSACRGRATADEPSLAFEILHTFDLPHSPLVWMSFNLSSNYDLTDDVLLAAGNTDRGHEGGNANFWPDLSIWNLGKLEKHEAGTAQVIKRAMKKRPKDGTRHSDRAYASARSDRASSTDVGGADTDKPGMPLDGALGGPFRRNLPHQRICIPVRDFIPRKPAFSPDGRWCVVVGNSGMINVYENEAMLESMSMDPDM